MNYKIYLSLLFVSLCLQMSCGKDPKEPDPTPNPETSENAKINQWIYEQLNDVYYWVDELPEESATNQELDPEDYFKTILWSRDRQSGFSYIESTSDSRASGEVVDFGMQMIRWTYSSSDSRNTLQVLYVVPNSPAEKAGIRRGDMFSHFNGTMITASNYQQVFSASSVTLTRCDDDLNEIDQVTVSAGTYYNTPVISEEMFEFEDEETGDIKRIGYLFYARFESASGTTDDQDLKKAVYRLKDREIDELVLDLRLNGGGYLQICIDLATMLYQGSGDTELVFLHQEYNENNRRSDRAIPFSRNLDRLSIDKLHVIVSNYTASASEIVIHGLKQYMDVVMYGEKTVGKNVGSHAITGSNKNIPWTLHPITSRLYDCRGAEQDKWQTFVGFDPDYPFDELQKTAQGSATVTYQGQLGVYDAQDPDCEPMLNYVMARLGYTEQMSLTRGTRSSGFTATPVYLPAKPDVLITD